MVDAPAPEMNENTNSPGDTGAICFTGDSLLTLKDGSSVTFHDLEVSELSELSGWVGGG